MNILQKCTPPDTLLKIKCLDTLSTVTLNQGDFQLNLARQLDILDIALRLQKIGDIYIEHMHNYEQALQYYSECLVIYQTIYNPRRKEISDIQNKIRNIQVTLSGEDIQTKQHDNNDNNFSLFD